MSGAESTLECDVLVVGGGPAGSTAAALLARRGRTVLLLEKDRHPRFHIGESLLPCNLPILEELGVLDEVPRIGVLKLGADFASGDGGYQTFRFARALGDSPPHAFQVLRADFDRLLFAHARTLGADARESVAVERVEAEGIGRVRASARDGDGRAIDIRARYLVDASGRDTLLGNAMKLKRRNTEHASAAIFAHYRGVERRPGDEAGNISIYRFNEGWCWFIPLPGDVMSIGCVCRPRHLRQRRGRNDVFLDETLQQMPAAWMRMRNAERIGEVRVAGNYSYACSRMAGPGWMLVGDAYAFVDPVFSSGVHLAMDGAARAAGIIDEVLDKPRAERRRQAALARRLGRGIGVFSWFIYRFNSPVMRSLFANPRNALRIEDGVISMLAGDVFDDKRVRFRLTLFRIIYAIGALLDFRAWRDERGPRRREAADTTPGDPA